MTVRHAIEVTIRSANGEDASALERLSQLDSARTPDAPILVAEVGGQLRAAYSLSEKRAIADPFRPTAELVALLKLRATQLNGSRFPPAGTGNQSARGRSWPLLNKAKTRRLTKMSLLDKLTGKAKKATGEATRDPALRREGRTEERKGEAKEELYETEEKASRETEKVDQLERRS